MSNPNYDGDSGLAYTGTVLDAYYEYDDEYDRTRLILETTGDRIQRLNTGKDWTPSADGSKVEHPTKTKFHKRSGLQRFIASFIELDGGRELLESRGEPTDAGIWKGIEIDFDQITDTFTNDAGEKVEYEVLQAVGYRADGVTTADNTELKAAVEALWAECKPDHQKFIETVYAQQGAVLLDPDLIKWVEDTSNWS